MSDARMRAALVPVDREIKQHLDAIMDLLADQPAVSAMAAATTLASFALVRSGASQQRRLQLLGQMYEFLAVRVSEAREERALDEGARWR